MNLITTPDDSDELTICDREPIHKLGKVQAHGYLIGVSKDWCVTHLSENCSELFGTAADKLLGKPAIPLLGENIVHDVRNRMQSLSGSGGSEIIAGVQLESDQHERRLDLTISLSGGTIVIELEHASNPQDVSRQITQVQQAINRVARFSQVQDMLNYAVRYCSAATGYDRVMAYQFHTDGSGEVVSEVAQDMMDPYLGLRYPATDIPKQARELYIRNPIRTIGDTSNQGFGIHAEDEDIIDLSDSVLRSVSPIHLEYLRNMNVSASMSISIIVNGTLWGLIACHHTEPKVLPQHERNAMLLFGQMLSLLITKVLADEDKAFQEKSNQLIASLSTKASKADTLLDIFNDDSLFIMKLLGADGMAVVAADVVTTIGEAPEDNAILAMTGFLREMPTTEIFVTHELKRFYEAAEFYQDVASGLLALPISNPKRDYLMFFRKAVSKTVTWAGNPDKAVTASQDEQRINPRKSFAAWKVNLDGQSVEWLPSEVKAAENLRITVLEVVLKMTELAAQERKRANEKQEVLVAELNHRVRNILNLVRSIVSQTSKTEQSTSDFVTMLEDRVQALARAHDQITRVNWSPASLKSLIIAEGEGYLSEKKDRLSFAGIDVLITPAAFSAMALVIHELMTNSAKYGSLTSEKGKVNIKINNTGNGDIAVSWEERDGPPVSKPKHQGFGTGIITRSIPFELGGKAKVDYHTSGLRANFVLPAEHIRGISGDDQSSHDGMVSEPDVEKELPFPQDILLVEDNLLISMDVEEMLTKLGAKTVQICPSVESAIKYLDEHKPELGMLDINLGAATSVPVAEKLQHMGIPFAFSSGYGDLNNLPEHLKAVPVLTKPYDLNSMAAVVQKVLK